MQREAETCSQMLGKGLKAEIMYAEKPKPQKLLDYAL